METSATELRVRSLPVTVRELGLAEDAPVLAEQREWSAFVPMLHRAMSDPSGGEVVPAAPQPGAEQEDFCCYWYPALYLLVYNLGWTDPGLGLLRWFDEGRPVDDLRFALLRAIWDRGESLDLLAAWLWTCEAEWATDLRSKLGLVNIPPTRHEPGEEWWVSLSRRFESLLDQGIHTPFYGGGDPLHLSIHILGPSEPSEKGEIFHSSIERRRAVLVLDDMRGWFGSLARLAATLPELGDRSWHVGVLCKPVGYLGTYRKSRVTGMWFSGSHQIHMMGNPDGGSEG